MHILLFVYGSVAMPRCITASTFVINDKLSRDARLTAFKIFINLDMLPRYCMALMLTVGGILAEFVGYEHPLWQTIAIVALGPIWVWVVHMVHAKEGTDFGRMLAKGDYWFRFLMIFGLLGSVIYHWITGPLQEFPWLRRQAGDLCLPDLQWLHDPAKTAAIVEGFRVLASKGATPDSDKLMHDGIMACRPYVWAIWIGVALSAWLGIWKPGMGG